jgi:hypothetical protein
MTNAEWKKNWKARERRVRRRAAQRARKPRMQSAAAAVVAWMAAYYIIIYFHLDRIRQLVSGPKVALWWSALVALTLLMKGGFTFFIAITLNVGQSMRSITTARRVFTWRALLGSAVSYCMAQDMRSVSSIASIGPAPTGSGFVPL